MSSLSAEEGRRLAAKKENAQPSSPFLWLNIFCVLFFSLCLNLFIWPGRQVIPYESRCYTPIFDGLVYQIKGATG